MASLDNNTVLTIPYDYWMYSNFVYPPSPIHSPLATSPWTPIHSSLTYNWSMLNSEIEYPPSPSHSPLPQCPLSTTQYPRPSSVLSPNAAAFSIEALLSPKPRDLAIPYPTVREDQTLQIYKANRVRTVFTEEQLVQPQERFASQQYLGGALSKDHNLTNKQTMMCFQNKRAKWRKEQKETKVRIKFTEEQLVQLQERFASQQYLDRDELLALKKDLNLTYKSTKLWFQNKRAKWRKEQKEIKVQQKGSKEKQDVIKEENVSESEDDSQVDVK